MASNGLVANQSKTEFLLLNEKSTNEPPLTAALKLNRHLQCVAPQMIYCLTLTIITIIQLFSHSQ